MRVKIMESQYLQFEMVMQGERTNVYEVISKSQGTVLGGIKWYGPWRQYCFFPIGSSVWNNTCLENICAFLAKLKRERMIKII